MGLLTEPFRLLKRLVEQRSAVRRTTTVDLWGKQIVVDAPDHSHVDPTTPDRARHAFLALNDLYLRLMRSTQASSGDHHVQQDEHYRTVYVQFEQCGTPLDQLQIDADAFERFLQASLATYRSTNNYLEGQGGLDGYFPQKAFEHWISAELLQWKPTDRVLDFAAWISPAVDVLAAHRPADFYKHDITFTTDLAQKRVSGFSDAVEAPDDYFDYVMAHCAIDNFEGLYDTKFFAEAWRILKPGGKLLITPLHMSARYENRVAIGSEAVDVDPGAALVVGAPGTLRFARLYSVEALHRRVIVPALGLDCRIVHVNGLPLKKYSSTCTNRFMLVATKRA